MGSQNIQKFFRGRRYPRDWCGFPIILRWLGKKSMQTSVDIIDDKVAYLMNQSGGTFKLKEWFLSDDQHLVTTTAERYILDHIRSLNPSMQEIFGGSDVDAAIEVNGEEYGIEVTCMLETIAEWTIIERIQQFIDQNSIVPASGLQVSADLQAIINFHYFRKPEQCDVVEQLSTSINKVSKFTYKGFTIQNVSNLHPGSINWEFEQDKSNPYNDLLKNLTSKIDGKKQQLSKREKNILLINVGSMPVSWMFPSLFEEMTAPDRWSEEIAQLEQDVLSTISETTVKAVCFFVYSLDKVTPFYALKLITNDIDLSNGLTL
jgi:hypothetical protein